MNKIKYIIVFCSMFVFIGCTSPEYKPLDFMTVFNAYKWLGDNHEEERYTKIKQLIDAYEAEETITGIDSVPQHLFDLGPQYYRYIAKCTGVKFEHMDFTPTSDEHYGIAYIGEIENNEDKSAPIYDTLKIYFPDTISARAFVDDAVKHGSKRIDYNEWAEYMKKNPSDNSRADSLSLVCMKYSSWYFDKKHLVNYNTRVMSEKDKNVVSVTWTW